MRCKITQLFPLEHANVFIANNKFVHQNNNFVQTIALANFAFMVYDIIELQVFFQT